MKDDRPIQVSIILVNYNGAEVVINCLRSLEQHLHSVPYETIVVDNASSDGSPALIQASFPKICLIRQAENRGFGAGNNVGAALATGEFLFLLNTDTLLISNVLPHLVTLANNYPEVGIIGPKLLNSDGSLQLSVADEISIRGEYQTLQQHQQFKNSNKQIKSERFNTLQEVDIVLGAAFFIRKQLFDKLNGFDETFFMYFEESDLCQRARNLGWKVFYTPGVELIHLGGYSTGKLSGRMALEYRRSQLYYYQKHRSSWEQIVLRIYLLMKFSLAALRSHNQSSFKILASILDFRHYPIKLYHDR